MSADSENQSSAQLNSSGAEDVESGSSFTVSEPTLLNMELDETKDAILIDLIRSKKKKTFVQIFVRRYQFELTTALAILLVLIIILASIFGSNLSNSYNRSTGGNIWFTTPSSDYNQYTNATTSPEVVSAGSNGPGFSPKPTIQEASIHTIPERLAKVFDITSLEDSTTSLGRAYQWIQFEDEAKSIPNYETLVQRFILAAFYFSSGGGRTSATWKICSAVPNDLVDEISEVATRCVFGDAGEDQVICAKFESFLECPEYYEDYGLDKPDQPKRRWLSAAPECDWYGITCNSRGRVETIALPNNGLEGVLLPELDLLIDIEVINLGGNSFIGPLPEWDRWNRIKHFFIYESGLEGEIPNGWKYWGELRTLDLAKNSLNGPLVLPGNWMEAESIMVNDNDFDIALRPNIGDTEGLAVLNLSGNNVVGSIPSSIGRLEELRKLDLSYAKMTGILPNEIGQLSNLMEVRLENNSFRGLLSDGIWNLTNLRILNISNNQFAGTLSDRIGNLLSLEDLSIENCGFESTIPSSLGSLPILEQVHLHWNSFSGEVPGSLCRSTSLVDLSADCDGPGSLPCACCTQCCNKKKQTCSNTR